MFFIDNLAFTEALLFFAAALLTYVGLTTWWAMRQNEPDKVQASLKGAALPIGAVGFTAVTLGLWEEMVWPYPSVMGQYDIMFNDVTLIFGIVLIALAATAYLGLRLQYVGVLAFMAGVVTLLYGWTAYGYGYTKEPFQMLLLYAGFSMAGILSLPATIITDYYLGTVAKSPTAWRTTAPATSRLARFGTRGVQGFSGGSRPEGSGSTLRYRVPMYLHIILLLFPVFMALAGVAAWGYLGTTVPAHLKSPP